MCNHLACSRCRQAGRQFSRQATPRRRAGVASLPQPLLQHGTTIIDRPRPRIHWQYVLPGNKAYVESGGGWLDKAAPPDRQLVMESKAVSSEKQRRRKIKETYGSALQTWRANG